MFRSALRANGISWTRGVIRREVLGIGCQEVAALSGFGINQVDEDCLQPRLPVIENHLLSRRFAHQRGLSGKQDRCDNQRRQGKGQCHRRDFQAPGYGLALNFVHSIHGGNDTFQHCRINNIEEDSTESRAWDSQFLTPSGREEGAVN